MKRTKVKLKKMEDIYKTDRKNEKRKEDETVKE